jgi:phage terminase small subunit
MSKDTLAITAQQRAACDEYIAKNFSIADAAKSSGIPSSRMTAWVREHKGCMVYIKTEIENRSKRTKVDADVLLIHLAQMMDADVLQIMNEKGTEFAPIKNWPQIWRKMVTSMGQDKDGNWQYKFVDRMKVIELVGKHTNIAAWVEKAEIQEGLGALLLAAGQRIEQLQREVQPVGRTIQGEATRVDSH